MPKFEYQFPGHGDRRNTVAYSNDYSCVEMNEKGLHVRVRIAAVGHTFVWYAYIYTWPVCVTTTEIRQVVFFFFFFFLRSL